MSDSSSLARERDRDVMESVGHHLRTPLTVVLGHAELLADREPELPPTVGRAAAPLLRAAQRLHDVVVGVCDLMDLACGGSDDVCVVDVPRLVADEVATVLDRAALRGIRVHLSGRSTQPWCVDPRRVRRALRELLDNALTYTADGSTVSIEVTRTETTLGMSVTDEGDGIDAGDRRRLARPFERGEHPRQPAAGRGMGLAIASAVAVWHGGHLTLSRADGGGLRACIQIPADART